MKGSGKWSIEDLFTLSEIFNVSVDYRVGKEPLEPATPLHAKAPGSEEPGANVMWARRGSNPRPTDYKSVVSPVIFVDFASQSRVEIHDYLLANQA